MILTTFRHEPDKRRVTCPTTKFTQTKSRAKQQTGVLSKVPVLCEKQDQIPQETNSQLMNIVVIKIKVLVQVKGGATKY